MCKIVYNSITSTIASRGFLYEPLAFHANIPGYLAIPVWALEQSLSFEAVVFWEGFDLPFILFGISLQAYAGQRGRSSSKLSSAEAALELDPWN